MRTPKLLAIVGQTSSGKSDLGIYLAKKFNGEVVSADSRQVYRGLNLASGKITKKEMKDIPHHLLNVISPKNTYNVAKYQKQAIKTIKDIQKKERIPFLVGGSPFYVYSVIDNLKFPEIKADSVLRKQLSKLSAETLFKRLEKLDLQRASSIETKNSRRLIRALEIIYASGRAVPKQSASPSPFETMLIGTKISPKELKKSIEKRLDARLKQGMIDEIQKLHASGVSYRRLEELGLEARYIALYLEGKLSKEEMREQLLLAILKFSKRQLAWFGKDKRIHWITQRKEAERLTRKFLNK
ncbi:MAG TPA: tRNA (adenosine(37)-N6)-dimethylallyltransferase MiaA [Candidatus Wildermuthbacteria bacterium]|nr:tRNA (adenosine(37)-N6)-dimethylallyltransferase MiaA [Candidatus Wildermuthbacteria bacterium]